MSVKQCCYIYLGQTLKVQCRRTQDIFKLIYSSEPDDYTLACYQHVGPMLAEDKMTVVLPIDLES